MTGKLGHAWDGAWVGAWHGAWVGGGVMMRGGGGYNVLNTQPVFL